MATAPLKTDYFVRRCTPSEGTEQQWGVCRNSPDRVIAAYDSQFSALEDAVDLARQRVERREDAQVHLQDAFDASRFETYWCAGGSQPRYGRAESRGWSE